MVYFGRFDNRFGNNVFDLPGRFPARFERKSVKQVSAFVNPRLRSVRRFERIDNGRQLFVFHSNQRKSTFRRLHVFGYYDRNAISHESYPGGQQRFVLRCHLLSRQYAIPVVSLGGYVSVGEYLDDSR